MNTMPKLIKRAKRCVVRSYEHSDNTDRPWLEASPPDSYKNPSYRMTIFVLNGSPAKGFVVANYGLREVWAFDVYGRKIGTFTQYDDFMKKCREQERGERDTWRARFA